MRAGWEAQGLKYRYAPVKRLIPAERYLADLMMDKMLMPLRYPEQSAVVSIFLPCELLQEVGLSPYSAEGYSAYLDSSFLGTGCLQESAGDGIAETMCSYHRIFIGAALRGLLPRPKCIAYTNLVCDANMLTFRKLAGIFDVPAFCVDVPFDPTEEAVRQVADRLRELGTFLEDMTGRHIDSGRLAERLGRSKRSMEMYREALAVRADREIQSDLTSPMYTVVTNNILLGTKEVERFCGMLLRDAHGAPPRRGKHIYWMHTLPYWSEALKKEFFFSERAQIASCDMSELTCCDFDPSRPYEAMARRMVYNSINGPGTRRIRAGIASAKAAKADGVIWFNHWGCKHTAGISQLAKGMFEAEGLPLLVLDGDGCDRSNAGEGQTATRLGAFLEMIGARAPAPAPFEGGRPEAVRPESEGSAPGGRGPSARRTETPGGPEGR